MNIDSLLTGDRSERFLHPAPSAREIYIRPAIHPDPAPVSFGNEIRERIACFVEEHLRYAQRQSQRYLRASAIATFFCWIVIVLAVVYFGHAVLTHG